MGAAAEHRGNRIIARAVDERMPLALVRAERQAIKDENARLRAEIARLERELSRARRCLAACRHQHEERMREARSDRASSAFAISTLCRKAFNAEVPRG